MLGKRYLNFSMRQKVFYMDMESWRKDVVMLVEDMLDLTNGEEDKGYL